MAFQVLKERWAHRFAIRSNSRTNYPDTLFVLLFRNCVGDTWRIDLGKVNGRAWGSAGDDGVGRGGRAYEQMFSFGAAEHGGKDGTVLQQG